VKEAVMTNTMHMNTQQYTTWYFKRLSTEEQFCKRSISRL